MILYEQIKVIGFTFGDPNGFQDEKLILFEAGELKYHFDPVIEDAQLLDGEHDDALRWIELEMEVTVNYFSSQLNKSSNYTLPNSTEILSQPNADFVALANRLNNNGDLHFFPRVVTGDDVVDLDTYYRVSSNQSKDKLIVSKRAGFYNPATPLKMKARQPLTEYPDWIQHQV